MSGGPILVTGAGGLVGFHCCRVIGSALPVVAAVRNKPPMKSLGKTTVVTFDLTDPDALMSVLKTHRIRAVVHAAGNKSVPGLEQKPELAERENVKATESVTFAAETLGVPLVFISTDYVFDGKRGDYRETDKPCPDTVYGRTKLGAERKALEWEKTLVVRTAGVLGWSLEGFYSRMIRQLRERKPVNAFTDLYNSPISVLRLGRVILDALGRGIRGVVNVAGERTNRYDLIRSMASLADLPTGLVQTDRFLSGEPEGAVKDYSLNLDRFRETFPSYTATVEEDLRELVRQGHHLPQIPV